MSDPNSIVSAENCDRRRNPRYAMRAVKAMVGIVLTLTIFVFFALFFEWAGLKPVSALWLSLATTFIVIVAGGIITLFRRRFRFSLRSFLLFNVLCCVALALLVGRFYAQRKESIAVRELESARAEILYRASAAPDWLQQFVGKDYFGPGRPIGVTFSARRRVGQLNDDTLARLRDLRSLQQLNVTGPGITKAGLSVLNDLRNLQVLRLDIIPLNDEDLKNLTGLSRLKELRLKSTRFGDAGVANLTGLSQLEVLVLDGSGVTDASIEALSALSNLRVLSLNDTDVTDDAIAELRERLPNAKITNERTIPREQLEAIESIRELGGIVHVAQNQDGQKSATTVDLAVNRGNKVTDVELAELSKLLDVEVMELGNNPDITDAGLARLSGLTKLKTLYLYGTSVRGSGLVALAKLPNLESLSLQNTPVTDSGVMQLKDCQSLRWLQLGNTGVSNETVQSLQSALPELEIVR